MMNEPISLLTIVAGLSILCLLITTVYTWLEYRFQYQRQRKIERIAHKITKNGLSDDDKNRLVDFQYHQSPWLKILMQHDLRSHSQVHLRRSLKAAIKKHYIPLQRLMELVKNIAPPTGLMFTVVALMVVLVKQSHGLDHQQLLGDIGVALLTTAFSSLILIMELTLFHRLAALMDREYATGQSLIALARDEPLLRWITS